MTALERINENSTAAPTCSRDIPSIYHVALNCEVDAHTDLLKDFLHRQLDAVRDLPCPLPDDVALWPDWMAENAREVADEYALYLQGRHAGEPRRFFGNKAHALYFLQRVAPAKLVDGAWLYSAVKHPTDWRYHGLIRTYLEELGDGDPALNHVVLYRNLLASHDCVASHQLDDELYLQGALQLTLGHLGDDFLPEVIGYNLGYEQLPLHLLISAFELNELGIDPYYFTLHVTIDNASTGHARKAVEAVSAFLAGAGDPDGFLARLRRGYMLNELGKGSTSVIQSFDLEQELVGMLERKRSFGQHMHSDYCRLEGKTVNEWLAAPGQIRGFLAALEERGWIKRYEDPEQSRFWQLVDGPGAAMFGVFNGYEKQLLRDWIAGDSPSANPFRAQFRRTQPVRAMVDEPSGENLPLDELVGKLSPALHPGPEGLQATRLYARQFGLAGGNP